MKRNDTIKTASSSGGNPPAEVKPGSDHDDAIRPPRILQVLPALVGGGVERGTVDIVGVLARAGWQSWVASAGGPMVQAVERAGGKHITMPLDTKNPMKMAANARELSLLLREGGVDLVHVRSRAPAWSVARACAAVGTPWVSTFHGTYSFGPFGIKKSYNAIMTKGARTIAVSEFMARHVQRHYGVPSANLTVIPRGVDVSQFDPAKVGGERMVRLSTNWRLSDGEPVIMLPGRLSDWKGHALLIDALDEMRSLPGAPTEFRVLFVGRTDGRASLKAALLARAKEKGLSRAIQFVDDCDDMPAAYMVTDLVVSGSTRPEAFGRVVAEAQAMGRLTLAPRHGAAPEIVQDGISGWLYEPNTAMSLSRALHRALTLDDDTRAEMSKKAIAAVQGRFTLAKMGEATLGVYTDILTSMGRARRASGVGDKVKDLA